MSKWYLTAQNKFYDDEIALAEKFSQRPNPPWGRKYWDEWKKYMLAEKEKANR